MALGVSLQKNNLFYRAGWLDRLPARYRPKYGAKRSMTCWIQTKKKRGFLQHKNFMVLMH